MSKQPANEKNSVGGVAFFLGLFSLPVVLVLVIVLAASSISYSQFLFLPRFIITFAVGFLLCKFFITRNNGVYFHELRHALVSAMAGNKAVRMKVARKTGSFEYKYSKATAGYNAFISLAPYTLPLWTIIGLTLMLFLPQYAVMLLAFGLGIDCEQWWRDLSPHQTDISNITGGVYVGMLYVIIFELVVMGLIVTIALTTPHFLLRCADLFVILAQRIIGH